VKEAHSPDRSSVVVTLKHTDLLSFQEENSSVDNLVELGKVEDVRESRELLRSPNRVLRVAESVNETWKVGLGQALLKDREGNRDIPAKPCSEKPFAKDPRT